MAEFKNYINKIVISLHTAAIEKETTRGSRKLYFIFIKGIKALLKYKSTPVWARIEREGEKQINEYFIFVNLCSDNKNNK